MYIIEIVKSKIQKPASKEAGEYISAPTDEGQRSKAAVALGLLGMGVAATVGSKLGITEHTDPTVRAIFNSLRHPVLGYVGAWLSDRIPAESQKTRELYRFVGGSALNISAELVQSAGVANELGLSSTGLGTGGDGVELISLENLKDWSFAIAGGAGYTVHDWLQRNKESATPAPDIETIAPAPAE